jgi:hypothetical protein
MTSSTTPPPLYHQFVATPDEDENADALHSIDSSDNSSGAGYASASSAASVAAASSTAAAPAEAQTASSWLAWCRHSCMSGAYWRSCWTRSRARLRKEFDPRQWHVLASWPLLAAFTFTTIAQQLPVTAVALYLTNTLKFQPDAVSFALEHAPLSGALSLLVLS